MRAVRSLAGPAPAVDVDVDVDMDLGVGSVRQQVVNLVRGALATTVPDVEGIEPQVTVCANPKNGDYQW